jgi:hypothetical protein
MREVVGAAGTVSHALPGAVVSKVPDGALHHANPFGAIDEFVGAGLQKTFEKTPASEVVCELAGGTLGKTCPVGVIGEEVELLSAPVNAGLGV